MTSNNSNNLVFGLDIGTRSLVGSVGYMDSARRFNVIAHCVKEHETRAMIDGQIHDIEKVAESIRSVKMDLEHQLGYELNDVCIAAAGRVLKTFTVTVETKREDDSIITSEDIYSLELLGIEKAYEELRKQDTDTEYYCVGYSVVKYYLNDYIINNLEGHHGKKISADVLATFLPNDVVDGLYAAVNVAGLNVVNLTLEPIAAINIAIPDNYKLLNLALIDVGAGTSDISITKDGSIIAYGMIPHAGDEITEAISHRCLVDFNAAEKIKMATLKKSPITYKDIMGLKQKISVEDARLIYKQTVDFMTREIADKIIELNGGKPVSAVFVVGGGGKAYGFTDALADSLSIPHERVALRGEEVLTSVIFKDTTIKKDPLLVTPIGICMNYFANHNNFILVNFNDQRIKLYDNNKLTVVDACMQIGFPNEALFPRRGKELIFTLNGEQRMFKGEFGEPAIITINDEEANISTKIKKNDIIHITESTFGKVGAAKIEDLPEYKQQLTLTIDNANVTCPKFVEVNGELVTGSYDIKENDNITMLNYYTVEQLLKFIDIDSKDFDIYVNNELATDLTKIYEQFNVKLMPKKKFPESYSDLADTDGNEQIENSSKNTNNDGATEEATPSNDKPSNDIYVIVNKQAVCLSGKESYIFVDIFDFYPFDTRKAHGVDLIMTLNGVACDVTSPIKDSDIIEIYWK